MAYHCCVPLCSNDARYDKDLSFHTIPADTHRRKQWLIKIRRDEGPLFMIKPHTKVCSEHFVKDDFTHTLTGMKCLVKEATPSKFNWNDETTIKKRKEPTPQKRKLNFYDIGKAEPKIFTPQPLFHDYIGPQEESSAEDKLSAANSYIEELEQKLEKLSISHFGLDRFSNNPKLLNFYTGFTSFTLLMNVFHLLKPTADTMTRWTQVQRQKTGQTDTIKVDSDFRREHLPLVDQLFMFLVSQTWTLSTRSCVPL